MGFCMFFCLKQFNLKLHGVCVVAFQLIGSSIIQEICLDELPIWGKSLFQHRGLQFDWAVAWKKCRPLASFTLACFKNATLCPEPTSHTQKFKEIKRTSKRLILKLEVVFFQDISLSHLNIFQKTKKKLISHPTHNEFVAISVPRFTNKTTMAAMRLDQPIPTSIKGQALVKVANKFPRKFE